MLGIIPVEVSKVCNSAHLGLRDTKFMNINNDTVPFIFLRSEGNIQCTVQFAIKLYGICQ